MRTSASHDCAGASRLAALLADDEIDAALDAGLMDFVACAACEPSAVARIDAARQRIEQAWAARERYRARNARLARIAAEREARRAPVVIEKKPALPPAAAAVLARAKAKAAQRREP